MRKFSKLAIAVLLVVGLSFNVFAADLWKVGNTTINSSGNFYGYTRLTESVITSDTLTAAESGTVYQAGYVVGPWTLTLPTAAAGLEYTVVMSSTGTLYVDTGVTTDTIYYSPAGANLDAGDKIGLSSTGDSVTLIGASGGWFIGAMQGTLTDGGA